MEEEQVLDRWLFSRRRALHPNDSFFDEGFALAVSNEKFGIWVAEGNDEVEYDGVETTTTPTLHVCIECGRKLPSERWLNVHITELHDPLFLARISRNDAMLYKCVVEECNSSFASYADRRRHLIGDAHKFPKSFEVHSKADRRRLNEQLSESVVKKKKKLGKKCRFFGKGGGCRFGDQCRFRHIQQEEQINDSSDMEVDKLCKQMKKSSIKVPKEISFGRRRRR